VAKLTTDVDAHEIAFEAFGVRALVRATGMENSERLTELLPPGWRPCPASAVEKRFAVNVDGAGGYQVFADEHGGTKGFELDLALEVLESQVRAYVALHARDRIFVHAGVVAHEGRAIVIPGMSFAGKTTLVAALVRAGAIYYSDEFTVLDADGLVHPYARHLSVRDENHVHTGHPVESLGGIAGEKPVPIGAVVVTSYRPGAEWRPRRLSRGEGVLAMLSNTVPAKTRPKEALEAIARAVSDAVVIESERDEAEALVTLLLDEVGDHPSGHG